MKEYQFQSLTELAPGQSTEIERLQTNAVDYARRSRAESTLRAYSCDWKHFTAFCTAHGLVVLPCHESTVAAYIANLAETHRPSTIQRRLSSISTAHRAAGHASPTKSELVRSTLLGVKRANGTAKRQVIPVRVRHIREGVDLMRSDTKGIRDRAILLVGYAGALRRSEVVGLDVNDISFVEEGLVLTLRTSKTDHTSAGVKIAIQRGSRTDTCPVNAMRNWLQVSEISSGAVFRPIAKGGRIQDSRLTDQVVCQVLKQFARLVGLDDALVGGHSCRAGLITDAFSVGAAQAVIAKHSRHRSNSINDYLREATMFDQNVSGMVGL
ncbi:MAG: tyrosine-type recombinase/integrase [Chthonomonas sp.]|nr:tyrosine-type recombinase/integrase [Chthonomonas sp.]